MVRAANLPLLSWREDAALSRLRADRADLAARIAVLPRMNHRRVELTARLKELTARELALSSTERPTA